MLYKDSEIRSVFKCFCFMLSGSLFFANYVSILSSNHFRDSAKIV
jgi:hypothetical protein